MIFRKGFNGVCFIYEYKGKFFFIGELVLYKMILVCGYVFGLDFIGKYNSWDRVDFVCIIVDISINLILDMMG